VKFFTRSGSYISALACGWNQQIASFTDCATNAFQAGNTLIDEGARPARGSDRQLDLVSTPR
jgi:hypothetical protein